MIEINLAYPGGSFRAAEGTYDAFVERREEFLEAQVRQQQSVANQVRRDTEWLGRKAAARTRKGAARIQATGQKREELEELKYRNTTAGAAGIDFVATGRQTRKLLTAAGIAKTLGGRPLFSGLDVTLSPGTKLGLLGPNGSGKSTLMRVLAGEHPADAGTVTRAEGLRVVMFEQGRASLDVTATLRDALSPTGDTVMVRDRPMHVAAWAKQFLFKQEQLDVPVGDLSGGERARVRIAQRLPWCSLRICCCSTSPLTTWTFPPWKCSKTAWPILPERWSWSATTASYWIGSAPRSLASMAARRALLFTAVSSNGSPLTSGKSRSRVCRNPRATMGRPIPAWPRRSKPVKLSYREQQEWDQMEAAILASEERLALCHAQVEKAATGGHAALADACRLLEEAQQAVDRMYARWQELEAKRRG